MPSPLERLKTALRGRYKLERELGHGGMAIVYLTENLKHRRKVAVKVLQPELAQGRRTGTLPPGDQDRLPPLPPHIPPLHDSGQADGLLFYVMPYVDGESLRDRLIREKQLPRAKR